MFSYQDVYAKDPCYEAEIWLRQCEEQRLSLAQAWNACNRPDWMFWALDKLGIQITPEQDLRLQLEMLNTPLSDGRIVLDLITDERSVTFIELKRRRLNGEAIDPEVWDAAWAAAWSAARAAVGAATRAAAWDAAGVAAWAAAWDAVGAATRAAAWDAVGAATRAAAWAAAGVAAWAAAGTWQANKLREIIANPFAE